MLPHLEQEEVECLPLCRAYFTPEEVSTKLQEVMKNASKVEIGSIIKCMGVNKFYYEFMVREKVPSFVWYLSFRGCLKEFEKRFETPVQALKDGEAPKKRFYFF
jgi:hypothetical protein